MTIQPQNTESLKLSRIFLPCVTLASSETMACIRGADEKASHRCPSVALQRCGPIKQRALDLGFGVAGGAIKSLSISKVRKHPGISKGASEWIAIGRGIGTFYGNRSAAESIFVALDKGCTSNRDEFAHQDLTVLRRDLDQSGVFTREAIFSAPLLTVRGTHTHTVGTRH